jgi:Zn-dependent membrane protease YugP
MHLPFYFDPLQFIFLLPAMALAGIAQTWMSSAYATGRQYRIGMTGAEAARRILDANGLRNVPVEAVPGQLSDHYDPTTQVVRLSYENYQTDSLSAVGVAAHEVGHAIQHAVHYPPFVFRGLAVGLSQFGGSAGMLAIMLGIMTGGTPIGHMIAWAGVALFSTVVIFQLINLPVEFNASTRGKQELVRLGIIHEQELSPIRSVLSAAAMTYVAGTLHSALTLAYFIFVLMGRGRRRD